MLRPALEDPNRAASGSRIASFTATIAAPLLGWNTRDPIAKMPTGYASVMDNWIPREQYLELREGAVAHATGLPGAVRSFLPYTGTAGGAKLFGASGTNLYSVTASGAVGAPVHTILSPDNWQSLNITTAGGNFMLAVNGADAVSYDGTTFSAPAITGVDPANCIDITLFKRRIHLIPAASLSFWYLGLNSIAGAAVEFPMGSIFKLGGTLLAQDNWTVDAGDGIDDYAVYVTTQGEVAVFGGTDPSDADAFFLQGVFRLPKPISRNCLLKFNGDLLYLSQQGVYPLSRALQSTLAKDSLVGDQISNTFKAIAAETSSYYGWQMHLSTEENLLLVNIPLTTGEFVQFVMNTITGAWTRFTGWEVFCLTSFDGRLLAGQTGQTAQLLSSAADFGEEIETQLLTAYDYFAAPVQQKHWKLIRPMFQVNGQITVEAALSVDFRILDPNGSFYSLDFLTTLLTSNSLWDVARWDAGRWAYDQFTPLEWETIPAMPGFCAAIALRTQTDTATIRLISFDLLFERGGVL